MDACFHGGAFWNAVPLVDPTKRKDVVNADVLDAWFPPAPEVVEALRDEWLIRTSPPTHAEPMEHAIAQAFGLPSDGVLAGPGSSALMFHALRSWVSSSDRVLIVEPTYGEYAHLFERIVGCRVERFVVGWREPFDLERWAVAAAECDLAVLVNPNNPSGSVVRSDDLMRVLPKSARLWIDEAYLAYTEEPSMASCVLDRPNVAVLRSFSKSHALSGVRAAALFAHPEVLASLRRTSPPWWVSLTAQVAVVQALRHPAYYEARYQETHQMRRRFAAALPYETTEGAANWLMLRLPESSPSSEELVARCMREGVFLRDAGRTAPSLGSRTLRLAVREEWPRVVQALQRATELRIENGALFP